MTKNLRNPLRPLEQVARVLNVNLAHTFENFKNVPGGEMMVQSFKDLVGGKRFLLMIYGGVGNGKTYLLEASAIALYGHGRYCAVLTFERMLSTLKSAMNNPEMSYDGILTNYCCGDRLIMDDVGAGGSDTEFGDKILETIVCARYGRQLLTIMSTNRDIESLPERVISRLQDRSTSYLIFNKSGDYRLTLK